MLWRVTVNARAPTKAMFAVWDGRISPVLDVSREALVLTIEGGAVVARRIEPIAAASPALKVERLVAIGAQTLVCGAVSAPLHRELSARGVNVVGFVAGDVDEVIAAFLAQGLPAPSLSMPGCCRVERRRYRGGRGQGVRPERGCGRRGRS